MYVLCTSPIQCLLVKPTHKHGVSFSCLPDTLVPILPIEMEEEVAGISDLPFYRHQVPVTLSFVIMNYKCRGSTFLSLGIAFSSAARS
jgi:hypothetical protein